MKRITMAFLLCGLLVLCAACANGGSPVKQQGVTITDDFGNVCTLTKESRVVSCYASFAECWLLSGGELVGVTEDAGTDHGLDVGEAQIVGTVKHIDLEKVVSLKPDYVILSADLTAHMSLKDSLEDMGVPYGYFHVDVFEDYKNLMSQFCAVSGREDLFEKNVLDVETQIDEIRNKIPETEDTVLLLRAFSTGMKAKQDDNLAGQILKEFGLSNIAEDDNSMLEELSLEHIVKNDPDFIFAMTMGDEEAAMQYLAENATTNPAWSKLSAVENGRYYVLPKELFHYKPNNRWSESYEYLAKLIWPDVFGR